ncbi:hypothetical protein ACWGH8_03665 [Nonomuraea muscovyensis]|uniref:Secreted protein n=1 Tax=Nonomuraea muscovyensis TaxID=1124761 RepID=A0A7X0F0K5_9ACTN|nr:hypothetical protein [Nonomuraea muscovyensis]MBB6351018.1 hypothetical protein [Nonomuraea muscovyensis]MDF2706368.1 hypothetical protein [Nonomuraea muscovyensis]
MRSLIATGGMLLATAALTAVAAGPAGATDVYCSANTSSSSSWQSTENGETKTGSHGLNECKGSQITLQPGWWTQVLKSMNEDD